MPSGQSVSIALCTYNGERYLPAQLESMTGQTRLPDELVVCDDASSDGTLAILQQFAATAPFPVRVHQNSVNLRSTPNFEQAIRLCAGDVIVLSDQDDVWRADKIERLEQALADENLGMVFSDACMVDAELQPLGFRLWESLPGGSEVCKLVDEGKLFERLLQSNVVTGATMAFRASLREIVLPIPSAWVHDTWLALVIAAAAPCRALSEPLILYRQHAGQQIGASRFSLAGLLRQVRAGLRQPELLGLAAELDQSIERLESNPAFASARHHLPDLRNKSAHLRARQRLRESRLARVPGVLSEWWSGRYHRYGLGWLTMGRDLLSL